MPSQVATSPMIAAQIIARPGLLVRRSAVAAGPTSSAVLRIAPMVSADSATARAIATRHSAPTRRTGTPRTKARSGLTELSSNGRYSVITMARAARLSRVTTGMIELLMVKIEPNRIVIVAPVVEVYVASQ